MPVILGIRQVFPNYSLLVTIKIHLYNPYFSIILTEYADLQTFKQKTEGQGPYVTDYMMTFSDDSFFNMKPHSFENVNSTKVH